MAKEETRKLNINYSNKNRGFKKKFSKPAFKSKSGEEFLHDSEIFKNGAFKEFEIGAKYCLPTNKLNDEQLAEIKELFGEGEEKRNLVSSFGINDSGWIGTTIETSDICGNNPVNDIDVVSPAIDKYRSFAEGNKELFVSSYGYFKATIDFSKLNMLSNPYTDEIYYPYGAMFFSDNKHMNQFEATVACIPKKYDGVKNKKSIKPVTCENWTNAVIEGNFTRHGYLVIFYVTEETVENDNYNPTVKTVVIEIAAKKDYKTSKIEDVYIGRVKTSSDNTPDLCGYIVDEIYKKYATFVEKSNVKYCMIDWIFSVGNNPKNYDLTLENKPKDTKSPDFKSNLSIGNKRRVVVENNESQVDEAKEEAKADCVCDYEETDESSVSEADSEESEVCDECEAEAIPDAEVDVDSDSED